MKSVPRHGVYWEMEFVRQWYRFWMECPLEELVGTPAGHRDNKKMDSDSFIVLPLIKIYEVKL